MSSISSAAPLAVGPSDSTGPGCEPSPLARSMRGVAKSSAAVGRRPECTETSETSRPVVSPMTALRQSTLWPEAPPAKTPARPTMPVKVSTATVPAYSGKPSVSSKNSDPVGSFLRTFLVSELAAMTGYTMHWSERATPSGRSWWVLGTPALPIGEIVSGLSQTPRRCSGLRSRGVNQTEITRWLLPTATAAVGRQGPRTGKRPRQEGKSLRDLARGQIGTAALFTLVEWMMGYPKGWLKSSLPLLETPSFQSSPNLSAAPSCKPKD